MSSLLKEDIYHSLKKIEGSCYQDNKGNNYILEIDLEQEGISKEGICFFAKYDDGTRELLTTFHPTVINRKNLEHLSLSQPKHTEETLGIGMRVDKSHAKNKNAQIFLEPTPYYSSK